MAGSFFTISRSPVRVSHLKCSGRQQYHLSWWISDYKVISRYNTSSRCSHTYLTLSGTGRYFYYQSSGADTDSLCISTVKSYYIIRRIFCIKIISCYRYFIYFISRKGRKTGYFRHRIIGFISPYKTNTDIVHLMERFHRIRSVRSEENKIIIPPCTATYDTIIAGTRFKDILDRIINPLPYIANHIE